MQELRVNTVALQAMVARWGASAGELAAAETPSVTSFSSQPSAAAVSAAHADVGFFTATLASQVNMRATHVSDARIRFAAGEEDSANELSAALDPTDIV